MKILKKINETNQLKSGWIRKAVMTNRGSRIVNETGKVLDKTNDELMILLPPLLSPVWKSVTSCCPPTRSIWTRNIDVEVNVMNLFWPPTNCRALSPENALFAMVHMSLTLERKSQSEFPVITKNTYYVTNILMLEGQGKPFTSDEESEKVPDKTRR